MNFLFKKFINAKKEEGFTLVELLFVVVFMGLVFGLIFMTVVNSSNTTSQIMDETTSEIDSRTSLYSLSKNLREATSISSASGNSISFTSDIDDDSNSENINYYLQSEDSYNRLLKSIDSSDPVLIADYVINDIMFEYYSDLNTQLSTPLSAEEIESIKIIKIHIDIDQGGSNSVKTMNLSTSVTLRNRI
jgi:competence protein ComGC